MKIKKYRVRLKKGYSVDNTVKDEWVIQYDKKMKVGDMPRNDIPFTFTTYLDEAEP